MKNIQHRWFLGAGVVSAIVASLCCLGPLVVLSLGLGSFAAASWFAEWRPVFLAVAFTLLGAGWFLALLGRRAACAKGACANPTNRSRASLVLLSLATLSAVGFAAYPWFAGRMTASFASSPTGNEGVGVNAKTLSARIPSMDCEACAAGIAATLRREPGVVRADVTYATKNAVVRFDPSATSTDKIIAAIDATGFPAEQPTGEKP